MKVICCPYKTILFVLLTHLALAQKSQELVLSNLYEKEKLTIVNRESKMVTEGNKRFVKLEDKEGEGLIWLPVKSFKNGEIEIWMRGKDVFQRSFIGIAFHGEDDKTYDAVYCRPFNFFAKDSVRKIHAIQYIAHPTFTWKKLREERNGMYEKEIVSPPNPNDWFKMTLVIHDKTIKGFINDSKMPSLTVEKLNDRHQGKIGIFMGDNSGGDFEKIRVKYQIAK
jgi:hypothetical protein